jgi:hypothetical protein
MPKSEPRKSLIEARPDFLLGRIRPFDLPSGWALRQQELVPVNPTRWTLVHRPPLIYSCPLPTRISLSGLLTCPMPRCGFLSDNQNTFMLHQLHHHNIYGRLYCPNCFITCSSPDELNQHSISVHNNFTPTPQATLIFLAAQS